MPNYALCHGELNMPKLMLLSLYPLVEGLQEDGQAIFGVTLKSAVIVYMTAC